MSQKSTPWGKIIGCGCLVIILLVGGCFGLAWYQAKEELPKEINRLIDQIQSSNFADEGTKQSLTGKMSSIKDLASSGEMSVVESVKSLGVLTERYKAATNDDSIIDAAEAASLSEVMDDIIKTKGDIDFAKYQ